MTKVHRHEGKGGWIARVHGYKESPRAELDPGDKHLGNVPDFDLFYGGDCKTEHRKSDGKLFGPESILRLPEVEIVDTVQPE